MTLVYKAVKRGYAVVALGAHRGGDKWRCFETHWPVDEHPEIPGVCKSCSNARHELFSLELRHPAVARSCIWHLGCKTQMIMAIRAILHERQWWHLPRYAFGSSSGGCTALELALRFPLQASLLHLADAVDLCLWAVGIPHLEREMTNMKALRTHQVHDGQLCWHAGGGQHADGPSCGNAGRPAAQESAQQRCLGLPTLDIPADAGGRGECH